MRNAVLALPSAHEKCTRLVKTVALRAAFAQAAATRMGAFDWSR